MLNPTTVQASGCAGWLPSQPVLLYCNVVVLLLCHGEKSWVSFSVYCSQINHLFHFFHFLTSLKWNSRKENVGSLYLLNLDLKTISFTKSQCQNLNSNQKSLHYFWAKSGLQSDLVQVHSHWFLIHIIVSYFIKLKKKSWTPQNFIKNIYSSVLLCNGLYMNWLLDKKNCVLHYSKNIPNVTHFLLHMFLHTYPF